MPRNPEQDRATVIAQALSRGMTTSQISGVMGISKRTVTRVSSNLKKHGTPKAPPSGAKQGRPAKVTKSQAEAILTWISARGYTFYVKDLVHFLKTNHRYKGCDGTVRRALIRAGFRRKEPYRKSEITHWIPPEHEVNFVVIAEDIGDGDDPEEDDQALDSSQHEEHQSATDRPIPTSMSTLGQHSIQSPQRPAEMVGAAAVAPSSNAQIDSQNGPDTRLDPALRAPPHAPYAITHSHQQISSQLAMQTPLRNTPANAKALSSASNSKKRKPARLDDALREQNDALQTEVARQKELIQHLHQQLMQTQHQGVSLHHPQPMPGPHFPGQG